MRLWRWVEEAELLAEDLNSDQVQVAHRQMARRSATISVFILDGNSTMFEIGIEFGSLRRVTSLAQERDRTSSYGFARVLAGMCASRR